MQLCQWLALRGVLQIYLSISCYGSSHWENLLKVINEILKFLILIIETVFLTNINNKGFTFFYALKMVSGKRTKYQKRILDILDFLDFRLFTFENVASGYTL